MNEFDMNVSFISDTTFNAPSFKNDIKVIRIPEGVTTLAKNALGGESQTNNLRMVVLPSTITNIGENALRYNYDLREIIIRATTPPTLGNNAFANLSQGGEPLYERNGVTIGHPGIKIRVPETSVSTYRTI